MATTKKTNGDAAIAGFVDAIICVRQAIKQLAQQKLRELHDREITYEMLQVLSVLWNKHQINQQEVANATQKNKASLTPLIDSLVRMGLITRSEDPDDRRNKIITLTPKGKEYRKKFSPMIEDIYEVVRGDISDAKLREITTLLLIVKENILL
ncbi:MAG TPA: MarR family transcriptional regulator [Puia sp.]|nr:MarR family transcriptional regulator [Puia sp.]